ADVREILAWALDREPAQAAQVLSQLRPFLMHFGHVRESHLWLERVLAHRSELRDEVLAEMLWLLGRTYLRLDDHDSAAEPLLESIELYDRVGNRLRAATAAHSYAHVLTARAAHADALALREGVLAEVREIGDREMTCRALHHIGVDQRELGNYTTAREM